MVLEMFWLWEFWLQIAFVFRVSRRWWIWVSSPYEFGFSIQLGVLELVSLDFSGQLRKILYRTRNETNYILCFRGTVYFFFKCVDLKISCGRMRLDFEGKMVWFAMEAVTPN